ncbi:MAG TPA: GAF domain-containing protein, partial [Stellaceae bacterium]|nr:GAF domain-containing protein [Stellaceae bacterium]
MPRKARATVAEAAGERATGLVDQLEARIAALTAELRKAGEQQTASAEALARRDAELQLSDERYALVTQAVAEGIYDWDIIRNALWVSPRLIEIFGWDGDGSRVTRRPSQDWNDRVHPDDFQLYRSALRAALKGETPRLSCEYRIRLGNGEYRWVEDHAVAVRDETGWAVRLVGAVSDVTERKNGEQALREALDQQTATTEILQVINSSPGNLARVFDTMLEKALRLCEAAFGSLLRFDGEHFHRAATRNFPPPLADQNRPIAPFPGSALKRLVDGEPFAMVEDIAGDEVTRSGNPGRLALVEAGARTIIWVALRKDDTLLGAFVAYRQELRPFTDKQIALLQNFAAQAVIAMENARLLGELRQRTGDLEEALEYQTATSDVLKVISRSTFDLGPVLEYVIETAIRLCRAHMGSIFRLEDGVYRWAVGYGLDPVYREIEERTPIVPGPGTVVGRVALEGRAVQIADALADADYAAKDDAKLTSAHTMLGVPLMREGVPVGVIAMARDRVEPFSDKEIALVTTFADQAVIAIENTRLLTETREALEQQTATAEVLGVINSSPGDLAPVFDAMLEKATQLCEAETGVLSTYHGDQMEASAIRGAAPQYDKFLRAGRRPLSLTHVRLRAGERVIQIANVETHENYRSGQSMARALFDLGGVRTILLVPLRKEETVLGAFAVYRQLERPFSDKQIALLENFAAQAVIAMENARLITETREALEQQTATAEVLQVINSSPGDLAPVFDAILEKAHALCGATLGQLRIFENGHHRAVALRGHPAQAADELRQPVPFATGPVAGPLLAGEPMFTSSMRRSTTTR